MAGTTTRENKKQNGKKFTETDDFHEYEIRLTQKLQTNNEVLRRRALKEVDKWLKIRMDPSGGPLKPESFILWKGLFYALWMADKPLVQEQIAERISSFVNLSCPFRSMEFFKYGLNILCCEWFGIDQLRLDKFLMFVRRFLRNGLTIVKDSKYSVRTVQVFNAALSETVLNKDLIIKHNCMGLTLHVVEIFLEELAKVSEGRLRPDLVPVFLKPFVEFLAYSDDGRLMACVKRNVFRYLLEQSKAGQEYQAKFKAWSELGYPGGNINLMQKSKGPVEEMDDGDDVARGEKVLDPRAGRVDVILPQINFKPRQICKLLEEYRFVRGTNSKSRKAIASVAALFQQMSHGNYPLGIKKVDVPKKDGYSMKLKNAVNRLVKFEKKINPKKRKSDDEPETQRNSTDDVPVSKRRKLENAEKIYGAAKSIIQETRKIKKKLREPKLEKKIKKKKLIPKKRDEVDYDFSFERDSGTWYVYTLQNESDIEKTPKKEVKKGTVFSESKWETTEEAVKGKGDSDTPRVIIQSVVVLKKPRTPQSTSPGSKKVKIALNLNRSQEIHEHQKQVESSPGIPFDATKRPSKPLLKTKFASPIDPFYVLQ